MIQIIGLIVAVYAMYRTITAPLSMAAIDGEQLLGIKTSSGRLMVMSVISGLAFLVLAWLTMALIESGLSLDDLQK